ncbi:MAG: hypothetical protein R3281_17380, partial [Balneolaceae bacterium]|nr:hypothetical protein [Balneolaceae bacterium]
MDMTPTLDTWTILFLGVGVHGIVLAVLFFLRKSNHKRADRLLGVLILLFSLNLLNYVLFWTNYSMVFPHLMGATAFAQFVYGPILFLYLLAVVDPRRGWRKVDLLHFIPALLYLATLVPFYLTPAEQKIAYLVNTFSGDKYEGMASRSALTATLKSLHMAGYAVAIYLLTDPV